MLAKQVVWVIEREAMVRNIDQGVIGRVIWQELSTSQKAYSDLVLGRRKTPITLDEACLALNYLGLNIDQVISEICALNRRGIEIEPPKARPKGGPRKSRKQTKKPDSQQLQAAR